MTQTHTLGNPDLEHVTQIDNSIFHIVSMTDLANLPPEKEGTFIDRDPTTFPEPPYYFSVVFQPSSINGLFTNSFRDGKQTYWKYICPSPSL